MSPQSMVSESVRAGACRLAMRGIMQANNLLSDKYVAISNITGYYAKNSGEELPLPTDPTPPSRRTGVYQEESRQLSPSRPGADHSIVRQTDVSVLFMTRQKASKGLCRKSPKTGKLRLASH